MKVLFVCRGNVGRSQMASGLFTKYTGIKAYSAGIKVFENENQKLKEIPLAEPAIRFMKREGLDIAENFRKQLTPNMFEQFDKIIVMSEPDTIPEYLLQNKKVEFWEIQDPKGVDDKEYEKIIFQIKDKIKKFIKSNKLK
ncbi:MAG: low molecular weight phosphatase family protein [Candidatus Diapherotrites archaeon]